MISVPQRLLLGAGPSIVPDEVRAALALPTIGHFDAAFLELMEDTCMALRRTFRTANRATFPVSGTGSAGMETLVANLIRPGSRVVCGIAGAFGERLATAVARQGAEVTRVEVEWGRAIPFELLEQAARQPFDALVLVHGETSTGVAQPLDGLADLCRRHDALLLLDCVTSLAGHELELDANGVDAAFAGTQKCLNCPPGLAPFTVNDRARARLAPSNRSWYFDLSLLLGYWDDGAATRAYHHTAPINAIYALHEALRLIELEGMEARWERHARAHRALADACARLGLVRLAPAGEQLHPLLAVRIPDGVDGDRIRLALLAEDGIEISGGLGRLAGRIWRIGVMGAGAEPEIQERLLRALAMRLRRDPTDALAALRSGWEQR